MAALSTLGKKNAEVVGRGLVRLFLALVFVWLGLPSYSQARPTVWQTLAPGLEYVRMSGDVNSTHERQIHAFRIDLTAYQLQLSLASDHGLSTASVRSLAERHHAIVAINGGFFSPEAKPLGLRVQSRKLRVPFKPISWWGIFYTKGSRAYVISSAAYRRSIPMDFAVQVGPRLLVKSSIPALKGGIAQRSALGITKSGKVVIVATDHYPLTTTELAQILRRPEANGGLGCRDALNLDGGRSTQIYAKLGRFQVNVPNLNTVTDAILVLPRPK